MLIYKVTNKINNEFYVGKTVDFNRRKSQHKKSMKDGCSFYFHNALRKYGWKNFKWEVIERCDNEKELNEKEIYYIKDIDVLGYRG